MERGGQQLAALEGWPFCSGRLLSPKHPRSPVGGWWGESDAFTQGECGSSGLSVGAWGEARVGRRER